MDYDRLKARMKREWEERPKDLAFHKRRQQWLNLQPDDQSEEAIALRREFERKIA